MPLALISYPVNLLDSKVDAEKLSNTILEIEKLTQQKVELVFIDTLSKALSGGDENISTDTGKVIKNLELIKRNIKATLLLIHHRGKDTSRGIRGHSSIRAALDTSIELIKENNLTKVKIDKQRDLPPMHPFYFKLEPVFIGTDSEENEVSTCIVVPSAGNPNKEFPSIKSNSNAAVGLRILQNLDLGLGPINREEFRCAIKAELYEDDSPPSSLSTGFKRILDDLTKSGHIEVSGEKIILLNT
ncbi:MAG: AAA family ATPase [Oligoflexia bacterium]|nr:AAA family ATPase [Oligoflexia bacterium]